MENIITTSKSIAIISFGVGTILFALQLYNPSSDVLIGPGIVFIFIATIINIISFLALIFSLLGTKGYRIKTLKTIGVVLLNIPIAVIYFYILIESI